MQSCIQLLEGDAAIIVSVMKINTYNHCSATTPHPLPAQRDGARVIENSVRSLHHSPPLPACDTCVHGRDNEPLIMSPLLAKRNIVSPASVNDNKIIGFGMNGSNDCHVHNLEQHHWSYILITAAAAAAATAAGLMGWFA